jgi:hypothetical protein
VGLKFAAVFLSAAGAVLWAAPARAEVELQSVRWQLTARDRSQGGKPADITALSIKEGGALGGRLAAKVKLLNRGPAVEGILLRYAVTAKIARVAQPKRPAEWAVPFTIDEKRVPKVGANQYLEAKLDPTALTELYLRKIYSQGYWPVELKLQVMLEPRKDNTGALQVLESSLPVGQ